MNSIKIFKNRADAGRQLAEKLLAHKPEQLLILALPRGGVPIGYEVAKKFEAPLDTVAVRKIGAPFNPEFGVGAVAQGNVVILDNEFLESLGLQKRDIDHIIDREIIEMERQTARYRSGEFSKNSKTKVIIIVDDGLATGVTARAAIESVSRRYKPAKIIFAAPICARDTAKAIGDFVNVVCVEAVDNLVAISYWYEEFYQMTDEEVVALLEKASTRYKK